MAVIRCGWVLRPRIVMVLQHLTSQLCLADNQLVVGPFHACDGSLDHLMTDIPDLVRTVVVAHICNLDQPVIAMAQAVPNL